MCLSKSYSLSAVANFNKNLPHPVEQNGNLLIDTTLPLTVEASETRIEFNIQGFCDSGNNAAFKIIIITGCFNDTLLTPQLNSLLPFFYTNRPGYDFKLIFPTPNNLTASNSYTFDTRTTIRFVADNHNCFA